MAELIAHEYPSEPRSDGRDLEGALERVLPRLEGGFSFVLLDDARLIGVRDRHGFWPLALGRIEGGWVLASESAALDIVGAHYVRDIDPGEMVVIDASGIRTHRFMGTRTISACLPFDATRSPGASPVTPGPTSSTRPALQ